MMAGQSLKMCNRLVGCYHPIQMPPPSPIGRPRHRKPWVMPLAVFLAIMLIVVVGVVWWIHPLTRNW